MSLVGIGPYKAPLYAGFCFFGTGAAKIVIRTQLPLRQRPEHGV